MNEDKCLSPYAILLIAHNLLQEANVEWMGTGDAKEDLNYFMGVQDLTHNLLKQAGVFDA